MNRGPGTVAALNSNAPSNFTENFIVRAIAVLMSESLEKNAADQEKGGDSCGIHEAWVNSLVDSW